jgi:undecaprenyl-diphosphatase
MDQKLLFLINQEWTNPVLDWVMAVMSSAALWQYPLLLAVVAAVLWGGFRARAFAVVALVAFGMNDGLISRALKTAANRLRPSQVDAEVRVVRLDARGKGPASGLFRPLRISGGVVTGLREPGRSFPSNHASNSAAMAMLIALFWRKWGWLSFGPAMVVAYSRMYIGSHWPSDVLAGICLGLGVAFLTFSFAEYLWRRYGPRLAPAVAARHPSLLTA